MRTFRRKPLTIKRRVNRRKTTGIPVFKKNRTLRGGGDSTEDKAAKIKTMVEDETKFTVIIGDDDKHYALYHSDGGITAKQINDTTLKDRIGVMSDAIKAIIKAPIAASPATVPPVPNGAAAAVSSPAANAVLPQSQVAPAPNAGAGISPIVPPSSNAALSPNQGLIEETNAAALAANNAAATAGTATASQGDKDAAKTAGESAKAKADQARTKAAEDPAPSDKTLLEAAALAAEESATKAAAASAAPIGTAM